MVIFGVLGSLFGLASIIESISVLKIIGKGMSGPGTYIPKKFFGDVTTHFSVIRNWKKNFF